MAKNDVERGYSIVVMILGVGFYSFVISSFTRIISSVDEERVGVISLSYSLVLLIASPYLQTQRVRRFEALEKLMADHTLAPELIAKIRKYLFRRVEKWEPLDLINDMPSKLRNEVLLQIHEDVLSNIPFLQDKNTTFVADMLSNLKVFQQLLPDFKKPLRVYE